MDETTNQYKTQILTMCTCKLCNQPSDKAFQATILHKYNISYFACPKCGFIQTEEPYWLLEAYQNSINLSDTGLVQRNLFCSKISAAIIKSFFDSKSTYVDMAGGYGLFVRLMRDKGFNFLWNDLYTENIFARGFNYIQTQNVATELITSFEAFEHFVNPVQELESLLSISKNIFFSTLLTPKAIPDKDWWYYAFEHGQHISFYSKQSFIKLAEKFKVHFYTNNKDFHLFTEKKITTSLLKWIFLYYKIVQFNFYNSKFTQTDNHLMRDLPKLSI